MKILRKADFSSSNSATACYDMEYDAVLIEQSIATQYGILPREQAELPYCEWSKLVGGLMDNTPLGCVVATRMESDPKIIAQMSDGQKEARAEWRRFQSRKILKTQKPQDIRKQIDQLEAVMARVFGGDAHG